MPTYAPYGQLGVQVAPGDTVQMFTAADSLSALANSIVIFPLNSGPVNCNAITFAWNFATSPTAVVEVFGSNTAPTQGAGGAPQNGVVLYTSTNKQADNYTDNLAFKCYWMQLVSQSGGGALVATAHVR